MKKKRIDCLLVEKGFSQTRHKAKGLILAGEVLVNDFSVEKAGYLVCEDAEIRLRSKPKRFVGRGGDKIDPVFTYFKIDLENKIAIDIGASTGGFTDSMLQRGAKKVYAVDVGYNQLDYRLRTDSRVVVMEKTNARSLTKEMFLDFPSFSVFDVSFISVRKVIKPVLDVMKRPLALIILVKPQFELGREFVVSGGVVKNKEHQIKAVNLVVDHLKTLDLNVIGYIPSSLKGEKKGNQEYFIYAISDD